MADNEQISTDDRLAIAIATGETVRDAAKSAGVSESTAYRRLRNNEFKASVRMIRDATFSASLGTLLEAANKAAKALAELCDSTTERIRLQAAAKVLELSTRLSEQTELRERLEALEATQNATKGRP